MSKAEIKTLIYKLMEPVRTDEQSLKFCLARSPLIYKMFNLKPSEAITLAQIKNYPGLNYRFVEDALAINLPTELNYETEQYVLNLPKSTIDLLNDNPSELSKLILCRQLSAFIVQHDFRMSNPDQQLLLTMDTELKQRTHLLTVLLYTPIWRWVENLHSKNPLQNQLTKNYIAHFKPIQEKMLVYTKIAYNDVFDTPLRKENIWF